MYYTPPLLKERLHGQPWPITGSRCWTRLTERKVPPLRRARFPPSPVGPPHPACTNTYIHKNMDELWLGLLFQSSFIVGGEEVILTQQMG